MISHRLVQACVNRIMTEKSTFSRVPYCSWRVEDGENTFPRGSYMGNMPANNRCCSCISFDFYSIVFQQLGKERNDCGVYMVCSEIYVL